MTGPECLRFADWMARALHDPQRGYYARQVRTVGRRGDFSTSASAGTVLGEAIARWLREELRGDSRGVRNVIEVGGGDGSLSHAVRRTLGWWTRGKLQWMMVETSQPLRAQQEAKLGTKGVRWFSDMAEALKACAGCALIFHNELLDAFPATLLRWDGASGRWREVWITKESAGGAWREKREEEAHEHQRERRHDWEGAAVRAEAWKEGTLRDGQRIELGVACRDWLRNWASHWKGGAMLTLDYGDTFPQVYHRQPHGTVRAYFMQQRLIGPQVYENIGRQDITADVNFSDVITWSEALGWETVHFTTQREFLRQHGITGSEDPATAFLMDEHGAGAAFKALIQRKSRFQS
jgi:SAM-dependent MidA family methyltransferase